MNHLNLTKVQIYSSKLLPKTLTSCRSPKARFEHFVQEMWGNKCKSVKKEQQKYELWYYSIQSVSESEITGTCLSSFKMQRGHVR